MLRVLIIFLAILAITLAFVLGQAMLYLVAVVLLAGVVYLTTRKLKKAHYDIPESFMKAPTPPEVDLSSLGIMDIRPKAAGLTTGRAQNRGALAGGGTGISTGEPDLFSIDFVAVRDSEPGGIPETALMSEAAEEGTSEGSVFAETDLLLDPDSSPPAVEPAIFVSAESSSDVAPVAGRVRTRSGRSSILVSEATSLHKTEVLIPALTSLRASLGATAVCLLRQTEKPLKYHIESIVSLNSYARGQGSFLAGEPLLSDHRSTVATVYSSAGEDGFPVHKLGYYHEPISVRQVAMVPVTTRYLADDYLLVADTMNGGSLESAPARLLIEQFSHLIGTVLETENDIVRGNQPTSNASRPRREIINDEMERARAHSHSLALALVYLNGGEKMAIVDSEQIDIIENEFELRLKAVAKDGMVEHFGELTYGVFYHGRSESVAEWACHIHGSLAHEAGLLEGGVSVGVAILRDRHVSPDDLRADATAALKQAFESGECTIVE